MADKSGETSDWREKYLNALDDHETLERKCAQQYELLCRALARVSVAAEGQDDLLDETLTHLRDQLRHNIEAVQPAVAQIDEALSGFEHRREQANQEISRALTDTISPLQQLSIPRSLHKEIRHYLAQLPQRVHKVRLYPALLQQLAGIQAQALLQLQAPKVSPWQKLLGRASRPATGADPEQPSTTDAAFEAVSITKPLPDTNVANIKSSSEAGGATIHSGPVTPAAGVALVDQISSLLAHLLEDIDVPESILPKVQDIQARIAQGLNGANVILTLEAVRDLVMEAYLFANKAFATYLNNVNQELADIYSLLGGAVCHQNDRAESARQLQDSMMQQVADLQTSSSSATDLDQLKNMVQSQLGNIRDALNHFQTGEQEQQHLAQQLQELAEKIKIMEQDAEKNRTNLEKHRYKSLHDPLTDLPNREAYSERILYEFRRWQRYQHPLSLAICDLDYFKKINDNFGHQAGDRVLKVISRSIAKRLRQVDFFGRYGGEEFVVILPETNLEMAHNLLEKIRAAIASTSFKYKDEPLVITLSLGITEFRAGDTIESALTRADTSLYAAKAKGRNRCEID